MKIDNVELHTIQPYAKNPRKNTKSIDTVARRIEQYGFQQPIVVDQDNTIIVGHTRYAAAKKLKLPTVPVLRADLPADKVKAYRIMDNRASEDSRWDDTLLIDELRDLIQDDDLVTLADQTGFRQNELLRQFKQQEEPDLDKYVKDELYTAKQGDIWHLGEHRLACGSTTDTGLLTELMQEDRIDCIWQDPPYGVAYETANGINYTEEENRLRNHLIQGDQTGITEVVQLLDQQLLSIDDYVKPGAAIYICHDIRFTQDVRHAMVRRNYHISDVLIWKKNNASTWLTDYAKFYEPIFYGWRQGGTRAWHAKGMTPNTLELDDIDTMSEREIRTMLTSIVSNYHRVAKESRKTASLHPTVKPVRLIKMHLVNSTQAGDTVFDGFSGSGSTLIAAEQLQRKARCIELEPKFVDATIRRWQAETGESAHRSDGTPFGK